MTQNLRLRIFWTIVLCVAILIFNKQSCADNPASWSISEGTNGEDVFWTSPTAVDVGFPRYGTTFDFTRVEVFAGFLSVDVTDQLPASSGTTVTGSLPVTLTNGTFDDPTSGTSATVDISIDPNGFGQASITDVTLGTIVIIIPINITRIEVDADISVQGVVPGDFDGNLGVDLTDLGLWESSYGVDAGADTDFNGVSDGLDFLDWQRFLGSDFSLGTVSTILVPEPTTQLIAVGLLLLCLSRSHRTPTTACLAPGHCWRPVSQTLRTV
ncbi:MAG: hypothetical protein IH831_02375 [Planctomycetes bacterium]|nr:hypothetical protein [Planctomycetota bacterium]